MLIYLKFTTCFQVVFKKEAYMNYILISPYFPPNFQNFAIRLKERGINVLGIGSESYDTLGENLQSALSEYYQVDDMENWEEVAKGVAFFYHKYGKIDRIESNNEYWLELDAYLRTEFNIFGLKTEDLKNVKSKSRMKKLFRSAGAPVVKGFLVEDVRDLDRAIKKAGYPVVAKPDKGVGTAATYRLDNSSDLERFKDSWREEEPYFIEPFIENAELITYDGLIDKEGRIVFETSFNYSVPTLDMLESEMGVYNVVQKEIDPKLKKIGRKIVEKFGHRERFFHIEFFKKEDGSYITLEYNGRIAGGFIIDVYNHAHSIDLFDQYARLVSGLDFIPSEFPPQYGIAIGRRDKWTFENSLEDIRNKYGDKVKMVDRVPEVFSDLLGNDYIIITEEDEEEVEKIIKFATT